MATAKRGIDHAVHGRGEHRQREAVCAAEASRLMSTSSGRACAVTGRSRCRRIRRPGGPSCHVRSLPPCRPPHRGANRGYKRPGHGCTGVFELMALYTLGYTSLVATSFDFTEPGRRSNRQVRRPYEAGRPAAGREPPAALIPGRKADNVERAGTAPLLQRPNERSQRRVVFGECGLRQDLWGDPPHLALWEPASAAAFPAAMSNMTLDTMAVCLRLTAR